jgi:hypothetical protein
MAQKHEPQPVVAESLGHIAAVDEEQLEQAPRAAVMNLERPSIEASDDPPADVQDDDDPDPQP